MPGLAEGGSLLLLGFFALKLNLISRKQLTAALHAWSSDRSCALSDILLRQGALNTDDLELLRPLIEQHHDSYGEAITRSLTASSTIGNTGMSLGQLRAEDVSATLSKMSFDLATEPADQVTPRNLSTSPATGAGMASPSSPRFRILRPHAKGGLGLVSVAEDTELNREVALKEIQSRFAHDESSRSRFVLESEVTGGLEHPGIVPVYGAGRYEDGRPFYAMRFIQGDSLKETVDQFHQLGKQDKQAEQKVDFEGVEFRKLLGKFIDVCQAIEYAHSRGVLHRDLKPSNIMLGKFGETLVVDWGLAKQLAKPGDPARSDYPDPDPMSSSAHGSAFTQMGSVIGTPSYMSPEQAAGRIGDLGPASDVYSLGATLYYILTGQSPVSGDRLDEVLPKVQQAQYRRPRELNPRLAKGLEAICLKAMALRCEDRYASPAALAEDLERYLADEPLVALPESTAQRLSRWMRRHRTYVWSATATLLVIAAVSLVAAFFINGAREREQVQRREATQRLAQTRRIIDDLLTEMAASLQSVPGTQRVARSLLERAAQEYQTLAVAKSESRELQTDSGLAFLRLAQIQRELGKFEDADDNLQQCLKIFEDQHGENRNPPEQEYLAAALSELGSLYRVTGQLDDANHTLRIALTKWEEIVPLNPNAADPQRERARTSLELGRTLNTQNRRQDALVFLRQAADWFSALVERDPQNTQIRYLFAASQNSLGMVYERIGQSEEAVQKYRLGIEHAKAAAEHASSAGVSSLQVLAEENLGELLVKLGRLNEAEAVLLESVDKFEPIARANADVPDYLWRLNDYRRRLAELARQQGRHEEAEATLRLAIQDGRLLVERFPEDFVHRSELVNACIEIAMIQLDVGKYEKAIESADQAIEQSEILVKEYPGVPEHRSRLANAFNHQGRAMRRLGELEATRDAWQRSVGASRVLVEQYPDDVTYRDQFAVVLANYGSIQLQLGDAERAAEALEEALTQYDTLIQVNPDRPGFRERELMVLSQLGSTLHMLGQSDRAVQQLKTAVEDGEQLIKAYPDNPRYRQRLAEVYASLASAETASERPQNSDRAYRRGVELVEQLRKQYPDAVEYRRAESALKVNRAIALTMQQRYEAAAEAWRQAPPRSEFPVPLEVSAMRAMVLAETGAVEEAVSIVDEIPADSSTSDTALVFSATVYAIAYRLVEQSNDMSDDEKNRQLDSLAQRSLTLLHAAEEAGWFQSEADVENFKQTFADMMVRPGFQRLRQKLERR
jgi:serine/threonine-protein kinase